MVNSSITLNRGRSEDPVTSAANEKGLKVVGTRPIRPDGVDKVIGRASFGADHDDARHALGQGQAQPACACADQKINIDKALKVPGVHAIVTSADFPNIPNEEAFVGEGPMNFRDLSRNMHGARQGAL